MMDLPVPLNVIVYLYSNWRYHFIPIIPRSAIKQEAVFVSKGMSLIASHMVSFSFIETGKGISSMSKVTYASSSGRLRHISGKTR